MSQIAALLLMFLNEEDAFWALSQLLTNRKHAMHGEMKKNHRTLGVAATRTGGAARCVRCWAPFEAGLQSPSSFLAGFFVPGFPKLQRFQTHHDQIISKLLPRLKKHLVSVPMQQVGSGGALAEVLC